MTPAQLIGWQSEARKVQEQVAAEHNLTRHKMLFNGSRDVTAAKRVAMHRCRAELGLSYPQIGEAFNVHHTTVMHHLKGMETGPSSLRLTSTKAMREMIRRQAAIIHQQAEQIAFLTKAYAVAA